MAEVVLKDIDKVYPGNVKVVFKNNIEVKDKEFDRYYQHTTAIEKYTNSN